MIEHVLTVNAARALAVLLPPLAFGLQGLRLHRHYGSVAAVQLQATGFAVTAPLPVTAQRVRVGIVVFRWLTLCKMYIRVKVVRLSDFVTCGAGMAVILIAGEPCSFAGVDAYDLFLLHLEAGVTREHVHRLQRHGEDGNLRSEEKVEHSCGELTCGLRTLYG